MPTVCTIIPLRERTNVPRMYVYTRRGGTLLSGCDLIIRRSAVVADAKSGCVRYATNSRRVKNRHCELHKIYPAVYTTRPHPRLRVRNILSVHSLILIRSKNSLPPFRKFYLMEWEILSWVLLAFAYLYMYNCMMYTGYWLITRVFFIELRFVIA